jgi:hypothetical protein
MAMCPFWEPNWEEVKSLCHSAHCSISCPQMRWNPIFRAALTNWILWIWVILIGWPGGSFPIITWWVCSQALGGLAHFLKAHIIIGTYGVKASSSLINVFWQKLHSHAYTRATVCSFVSFTYYLIYLRRWIAKKICLWRCLLHHSFPSHSW